MELLIILWLTHAIIVSVREGVITTTALIRKQPVPARRAEDGWLRTIGRTMARGFVDDLAAKRAAGAELRTKKRTARQRRRTDRWEARQAKRRPSGAVDLDERIPDWARGRTDDRRPDGLATPPTEDRPSVAQDEDRLSGPTANIDPAAPDKDRPPTGPDAPPPDQPSTSEPGRPSLRLVPPLPDILEAMPDMTTPTMPTGEIPTIPQLAGFLTDLETHLMSLRGAAVNALRVLTSPAESGGHGVTDTTLTGLLNQIVQSLDGAKATCPTARTALQPHIAAANALHGARGAGTRTASYTGVPAPAPEPAGV